MNKQKYKFVIDGIGIAFPDIYRQKVETGIQYQKDALLNFLEVHPQVTKKAIRIYFGL